MNNLSPIILFVYNRPEHTQRTIGSLLKCNFASDSTLYVFSDAAKNNSEKTKVDLVRKYINSISGFKDIIIEEAETNKGLASSVITGVSKVLQLYKAAIVLEDDLVFSEDYLEYMNECLNLYKCDRKVGSVSGYSFPINIPKNFDPDVYLLYRASSWGWGTWKDRWERVDWQVSDFNIFVNDKDLQKLFNRGGEDLSPMLVKQIKGIIDSWAVRWSYHHFKNDQFCLFPIKSKVRNIGMDSSGRHSKKSNKFDVRLDETKIILPTELGINKEILTNSKLFFKQSLFRKAINKIKFGI